MYTSLYSCVDYVDLVFEIISSLNRFVLIKRFVECSTVKTACPNSIAKLGVVLRHPARPGRSLTPGSRWRTKRRCGDLHRPSEWSAVRTPHTIRASVHNRMCTSDRAVPVISLHTSPTRARSSSRSTCGRLQSFFGCGKVSQSG